MKRSRKCGQPTINGAPCQNGSGCAIDHKGQMDAYNAGVEVGAARSGAGADPLQNPVGDLEAANDPSTVAETLAALSDSHDKDVRMLVAANTNTPADTLAHLAADPNPEVRIRVAGHKATPPSFLTALAADNDAVVRIWVASNPSTPGPTLSGLSSDRDADVRWRASQNWSTPVAARYRARVDPEVAMRIQTAASQGQTIAPS